MKAYSLTTVVFNTRLPNVSTVNFLLPYSVLTKGSHISSRLQGLCARTSNTLSDTHAMTNNEKQVIKNLA